MESDATIKTIKKVVVVVLVVAVALFIIGGILTLLISPGN